MKRFADSVPEMVHLQREMNRLFSNVGQSTTQDYPAIMEPEKTDISRPDPILPFPRKNKCLEKNTGTN
jgi:hypothetical protein